MSILDKINFPSDLRKLNNGELNQLADELRNEIIYITSSTGGHVASNLGIVDLTIALHHSFNTPEDKIVWDVSHQCYAHKLLTGRKQLMRSLRLIDGCMGFTSREESEYDPFGAGHAGTAISAALGLAAARDRLGRKEKIIAVVGDGSLTCGISYEGLNNIADTTKDLIIILNDNKMSISENVGRMANYLNRLIQKKGYNKFRESLKQYILNIPKIGRKLYKIVNKIEGMIKGIIIPSVFFEELGLRYIGPIDGHNIKSMINTFNVIKDFKTPVVIHLLTEKGKGFKPAETQPEKFHGLGKFDPETGDIIRTSAKMTFSEVFGDAVVELADKYKDVAAITAAMSSGTCLSKFAGKFPDRFFDVGIAEEHAAVFAAGLAANGLRPVFAVYATFLQRALGCVYHDICLQNLPVIICEDRSGVVEDGPTHHGIYELSYLRSLPNITIISPATGQELRNALFLAYSLKTPVVMRYPKAAAPEFPNYNHEIEYGKAKTLRNGKDVSIWATGGEVSTAFKIAELLSANGVDAEVVNTLFIRPFDDKKLVASAESMHIVTLEDNVVSGGLAGLVDETLSGRSHKKIIHFGWESSGIVPHGKTDSLKANYGLTADTIAGKILQDICHE